MSIEKSHRNGFSCGIYSGMSFVHFYYFNNYIWESKDKQKRKTGKINSTWKCKGTLYSSGSNLCLLLPDGDPIQYSWLNLHKRNMYPELRDLRQTLSQNIKTVNELCLGSKHISLMCTKNFFHSFLFHVFVFTAHLYQMKSFTVPITNHFVTLFTKEKHFDRRKVY